MARCPDPGVRKRWHTLLRQHSQSGLRYCPVPQTAGLLDRRVLPLATQARRTACRPVADCLLAGDAYPRQPQQDHFRVRLNSGVIIEIPALQTDVLLQLVDHFERHAEASQS